MSMSHQPTLRTPTEGRTIAVVSDVYLDHPSSVDTASFWGEDLNERSLRAEFGSPTCERTETPKQG